MKNKVPPVKVLYKMVSKNVLTPNTSFTYELWYSRLIGRHISIYFTWLFLHTNITPNFVTLIHTVFSLTGTALYAFTDKMPMSIGFIFFNFYLILDSTDGELARYKKQNGVFGNYLDTLSHIAIYSVLYSAIGINIYLRGGSLWNIVLGVSTALLYCIASSVYHLNPILQKVNYVALRKKENPFVFITTNIYNFVTKDMTIAFVLFFLGILNYPHIFGLDPFFLVLITNTVLISIGGIFFSLFNKIIAPVYKGLKT